MDEYEDFENNVCSLSFNLRQHLGIDPDFEQVPFFSVEKKVTKSKRYAVAGADYDSGNDSANSEEENVTSSDDGDHEGHGLGERLVTLDSVHERIDTRNTRPRPPGDPFSASVDPFDNEFLFDGRRYDQDTVYYSDEWIKNNIERERILNKDQTYQFLVLVTGKIGENSIERLYDICLLYTSPSPRD